MNQAGTNSGTLASQDLGILRSILSLEGCDVPKQYQNPKLEKREDVSVPYWFIRVRLAGAKSRKPLKLGFCHEMNFKTAMQKRGDILRVVNAGLLVAQARLRFRDVVEQFENSRLPMFGTGTQGRYRSQIKNHILPAFGDRMLADIDTPMIEGWLNGKAKDGKSWWTREGLRGVMSSIFAAAGEWKLWSGPNPAANVRIGKKTEVRELGDKPPITAEQLRSILAAVSEDTRLVVLIAAFVGLRVSEIMGLRWSDVDLDTGTVQVRRRWYRGDLDEPKTRNSKRRRELGPLLPELSRRYPGPHKREEYIFLGEDGRTPLDERDLLRYDLRPALRRLKLWYPGFGWHQFRRNEITWRQTVGGATAIEARKGAGHSRMDTTMDYTLIDVSREREQIQRMYDELMGGTVEGPTQ